MSGFYILDPARIFWTPAKYPSDSTILTHTLILDIEPADLLVV